MEEKKPHYVYLYACPLSYKIFYVGLGTGQRHKHHLKKVLYGYTHDNMKMQDRIDKILDMGLEPIIKIVFRSDNYREAGIKEREVIARLRAKGRILCNSGSGGQGALGKSKKMKQVRVYRESYDTFRDYLKRQKEKYDIK